MGEMVTSYGAPVTGTYGFCNALFAVMAQYEYDCVVPCTDRGGNFRKKESGTYKANREKASVEHYSDLSLLVEDVLPALGFSPVGAQGFEADDVVAHISRNSPGYSEVHILTCDKDLLQLVNDRVKVLLFNSAKKMELVDIEGVKGHFGVPPSDVKFFKALSGDSSDNISGVSGVGPKTAAKIIQECHTSGTNSELSLADRIAFHPKVIPAASTFFSNLRLVTLEDDVPDLSWYASSPPSEQSVEALFEGLEFKSYLKPARLSKILKTLKVVS
jgi:DNA polymerase-1